MKEKDVIETRLDLVRSLVDAHIREVCLPNPPCHSDKITLGTAMVAVATDLLQEGGQDPIEFIGQVVDHAREERRRQKQAQNAVNN